MSDDNTSQQVTTRGPVHKTAKRKTLIRLAFRVGAISIITITALYLLSMTAPRPTQLGVIDGKLANCPSSPNCVSTQASDDQHQILPIPLQGSAGEMIEKIKKIVLSEFPRTRLVSESDHYLHFEFKSLIFRFIDDVEFVVDDKHSVVHFRSASRVGRSDLGVNRKRMEKISERLTQ